MRRTEGTTLFLLGETRSAEEKAGLIEWLQEKLNRTQREAAGEIPSRLLVYRGIKFDLFSP